MNNGRRAGHLYQHATEIYASGNQAIVVKADGGTPKLYIKKETMKHAHSVYLLSADQEHPVFAHRLLI